MKCHDFSSKIYAIHPNYKQSEMKQICDSLLRFGFEIPQYSSVALGEIFTRRTLDLFRRDAAIVFDFRLDGVNIAKGCVMRQILCALQVVDRLEIMIGFEFVLDFLEFPLFHELMLEYAELIPHRLLTDIHISPFRHDPLNDEESVVEPPDDRCIKRKKKSDENEKTEE